MEPHRGQQRGPPRDRISWGSCAGHTPRARPPCTRDCEMGTEGGGWRGTVDVSAGPVLQGGPSVPPGCMFCASCFVQREPPSPRPQSSHCDTNAGPSLPHLGYEAVMGSQRGRGERGSGEQEGTAPLTSESREGIQLRTDVRGGSSPGSQCQGGPCCCCCPGPAGPEREGKRGIVGVEGGGLGASQVT